MKSRIVSSCVVVCSLFALAPLTVTAGPDSAMDRPEPAVVVKDSAITSSIKARIESEHVRGLGHVRIDTDDHGVVTLKGHVRTQDAADRAIAIAKATDGVREVRNDLEIKIDD